MNEIVQAALKYLTLGWPLIPCQGKKPLIRSWQNRTATNQKDLDRWQNKWPDMNIGLPLGSVSGIVGIDVDGTEAVRRLKELSGGQVPITWAFKTPGGGKRYLFQLPEGTKAKKYVEQLQGEHAELAFQGDGQQTILPPSVHPNGKKYRWFKGKSPADISLAPAPEWMIKLMSDKKSKKEKKSKGAKQETSVEDVFSRLQGRCAKFAKALEVQSQKGLSEESWFKWLSLLVKAGHNEAAWAFSKLSHKHNKRSDKRLVKLEDKMDSGQTAMPRCSTFGCSVERIQNCHSMLNLNDNKEVKNSPGAFIRDMKTLLPPRDPLYHPYVKALSNVAAYDIDESGYLCSYDKKGNPYVIANFVAIPTLEIIRDDGQNHERTFRIEGYVVGGRFLEPVDIAAKDFAGMNWLTNSWGIEPSIRAGLGKKDLVRDAIQNMGVGINRHIIFSHIGWRKLSNGIWAYLHASGAIGADNLTVELNSQLQRYYLPSSVHDHRKAARVSLGFLKLAALDITIPLLALTYLSPLVEAFKIAGLEPNFLLWLHGGTGTRKTSLALVLLCHFGQFAGKNPPASFKDTANALEMKAFATKDSLLLIDDYHPSASNYEGQKMAQIAQRVLRMYGDRIGRGRLKSTIDFQRTYPPRGMCLVTGEDLPQGQSSMARFLGLELGKDQVDLERLTEHQNNSGLLGQAMSDYIAWLQPQMDSLPNKLKDEFVKYRMDMQKQAVHGRLGEAAAWLLVAFEMMIRFMVHNQAIKVEKAEKIKVAAKKIMTKLVKLHGGLVNHETPVEIFCKTLHELIISKKAALITLKDGSDSLDYFGEIIGWADDEFMYLKPIVVYNMVSQCLRKHDEIIPVRQRTLWKHLDEAGLLYTEIENGERRHLVKKTIPHKRGKKGDRLRLLHVKRVKFENLVKG